MRPQFHEHQQCDTHTLIHTTLYFSKMFLTWLVQVVGLRVTVRCVTDWGFVGVGGELMIQLLRAVDENG